VWHLRHKLALVKFPRRIQVALASRVVRLDPATLVSLASPLVLVALVPQVLVMLVSLESPLVRVALAPLVLVAPVNPVDHVAPAVQASPVVHAALAVQVNPVVPQVRAALVSPVDQQARAGLEGQAAQAGNQTTRSPDAHDV
jgi:hypothetical protein